MKPQSGMCPLSHCPREQSQEQRKGLVGRMCPEMSVGLRELNSGLEMVVYGGWRREIHLSNTVTFCLGLV